MYGSETSEEFGERMDRLFAEAAEQRKKENNFWRIHSPQMLNYNVKVFDLKNVNSPTSLPQQMAYVLGFEGPSNFTWDMLRQALIESPSKPTNIVLYNRSKFYAKFPIEVKNLDSLFQKEEDYFSPFFQYDDTEGLKKKVIGSIFSYRPFQYGLRGDPFLWDELEREFRTQKLPVDERQLIDLILESISKITGQSVLENKVFFVNDFNNGGMSSGQVYSPFWVREAIPMLISRYRLINS